jgi:hypothetical protein
MYISWRDSKKTFAEKLNYFGFFFKKKDVDLVYDLCYGFFPNLGISAQRIEENKEALTNLFNQHHLLKRVEDFDRHDYNRIKNSFKAFIVLSIYKKDYFGFDSGRRLLMNLPRIFNDFVCVNDFGITLSETSKTFSILGYSRFLNDDQMISWQEKSDILDELYDVIEEISVEQENPFIIECFGRFRISMLGVLSIN